jgi:hypothetical protein
VPDRDADFEGTIEKSTLRRCWDLALLTQAHKNKQRLLSYLGLPGPAILDILAWRSVLGTVTGVERLRPHGADRLSDLERHRRMHKNIMVAGIEGFQLLRGEIEDVICESVDIDGTTPKLNDGGRPHDLRFQYDVINLDFYGGVAYRSKHGEHKRVRAIKKLFERQQGTDFALFLTINVRDEVGPELTRYLKESSERVDSETRTVLRWYATRTGGERDYKLKAVLPLFVQHEAESRLFTCQSFPVVSYVGNGDAHMVHFAFTLESQKGNFQAFSQQKIRDLLRLPMVRVVGERFIIPSKQHEGFDATTCMSMFDFLGEDINKVMWEADVKTRGDYGR